MLIDDCKILLSSNSIKNNRKAGFVSRNTSTAKMKSNEFESNKIDVLSENWWEGLGELEEDNFLEEGADIRTPDNLLCQLI